MKLSHSMLFTLAIVGAFVSRAATLELQERSFDVLLPRQSSGVDPSDTPSECQSQCTAILNAVNTCTDVSCFCTSANAKNMLSCFGCLVAANTDETASAENAFDDFNSECAGTGLPTLTLSEATDQGSGSGVKGFNGAFSDRLSTTGAGALGLAAALALL